MPKAMFVNLTVADLSRSKAFFQALGFSFDAQFTDQDAACLVMSSSLYAMLHTPKSMQRFTRKQIVDPRTSTEVLVALQIDSKDEVDALFERALSAGGTESRPTEDYGFMYGRSFDDLDGHMWELFWMDPARMDPVRIDPVRMDPTQMPAD